MNRTIMDVICESDLPRAHMRLAHLNKIEAPRFLIAKAEECIQDLQSRNIKVKGMSRKYKVSDVEVLEVFYRKSKGEYYRAGKRETIIIKMATAQGNYFYDTFEGKIENDTCNDIVYRWDKGQDIKEMVVLKYNF